MLKIDKLQNETFEPVSLTLNAGECLIVQGASGSGKTRFLRAIADLDEADGEVSLEGVKRFELQAFEWRRRVRYLAAEAAWWHPTMRPHFDHPENLSAAMSALDLSQALLDRSLSDLSTGERQRFSFLRAISDEPAVLLLDEPTSALDESSALKLEELIREEVMRGAILMIVTHSERQAQLFGHKKLVFDQGRNALVGAE